MVSTRAKSRASTGPSEAEAMSSAAAGSWTRVLVTGANAGLGLDTCKRLLTEFLTLRPDSQGLHLIVSTRSSSKSSATIETLWKHVASKFPSLRISASDDEDLSKSRLCLTSAELDLTHLPSVIHAARSLRQTLPSLHSIICNAGIAGWTGVDWPRTILDVIINPVHGTTWPAYLHHALGLRTKPQLPSGYGVEEPPLNEVFCANVFGHYILAHELGPLLASAATEESGPGRVVWVSSIETSRGDFNIKDIQCLDRARAYNSTKRLTDILALTSTLPTTRSHVQSLFSDPTAASTSKDAKPIRPTPLQYVCHPGVVATNIMPLPPILIWAKRMSFYLARALGSPWHAIDGDKAAVAAVWTTLSAQTTLDGLAEREGAGKWGSATDWYGNERVKRTEVDGWGFGGRVEPSAPVGEHRRGRNRSARDLTQEEREAFEELGIQCWEQMESLRKEWLAFMQKTGAI